MEYTIAKIKDKIKLYEKTGKIISSFFLTPTELVEISSALKSIPYCMCGGFDEAERKIIIIGTEEPCIDIFCNVLRIISLKNDLIHRNVLGSLLGLGIKRDMIGDLIINHNVCDVIVMHEMKDYILNNLKLVGREKVTVSEIKFSEMQSLENNKTIRNISVASLRIDAIISASYGISREKSANLINIEKVLVNHVSCTNNSKSIKKDDIISVRGYGRIKIIDILGETKKGRIRISIEIY